MTAAIPPPIPAPRRPQDPDGWLRRWYEDGLGWTTAPGPPPVLETGVRFDVLDVPEEAGWAALRHLLPGSPVAVRGGRTQFLVAAGSADELPGLLDWLEWGTLALDLRVLGPGGRIEAPVPPGGPPWTPSARGVTGGPGAGREGRAGAAGPPVPHGAPVDGLAAAGGPQGAAVWLRPPEPGCAVEPSLPTLSALGGGGGGAPDLVRLVDTVATECHRIRLRRASAQPLAFS
ncbi:SCO3374 family protein [Streptomyces minutiscleroticus]|uniref:SCO3374 family protein n=1 Tax=Streptomyces minutiscleroticus TaxID=68238 RepID=UPI003334A741